MPPTRSSVLRSVWLHSLRCSLGSAALTTCCRYNELHWGVAAAAKCRLMELPRTIEGVSEESQSGYTEILRSLQKLMKNSIRGKCCDTFFFTSPALQHSLHLHPQLCVHQCALLTQLVTQLNGFGKGWCSLQSPNKRCSVQVAFHDLFLRPFCYYYLIRIIHYWNIRRNIAWDWLKKHASSSTWYMAMVKDCSSRWFTTLLHCNNKNTTAITITTTSNNNTNNNTTTNNNDYLLIITV